MFPNTLDPTTPPTSPDMTQLTHENQIVSLCVATTY